MKTDTVPKLMYALTAVFVLAAAALILISVLTPSKLRVTVTMSDESQQEWADNEAKLETMLETMFEQRVEKPSDSSASNKILPNFQTLVNINTASVEELSELPAIGETIAQRIISHREENGPFTSIDQLRNVSGIGEKTFEAIENLVCISDDAEIG